MFFLYWNPLFFNTFTVFFNGRYKENNKAYKITVADLKCFLLMSANPNFQNEIFDFQKVVNKWRSFKQTLTFKILKILLNLDNWEFVFFFGLFSKLKHVIFTFLYVGKMSKPKHNEYHQNSWEDHVSAKSIR